jgi:hypothetical protein
LSARAAGRVLRGDTWPDEKRCVDMMTPFARIIAAALGAIVAPGAFCKSIVDPGGQSVSSDRKPVLLAQMSKNEYRPLTYFLDEPPSDLSQSTLPPSAGEIVVAKVRLTGRSAYLVGRDQSGRPPAEKPPEELFAAWLELLDVVRGKRPAKRFLDATFGLADNSHTYIRHPATPQQLAREYFVAIYEEGGTLPPRRVPEQRSELPRVGERVLGVRALAPEVAGKAIVAAKSDVGREAMSISVFEVGQASSTGLNRPFVHIDARRLNKFVSEAR